MARTQTETTGKTRTLKKISTDIIKLSDLDVGARVEGTFVGKTTGPWTDKMTGEISELTRVFFQRENGSKFLVFEDAGLRNAMANAMVKEGDFIVIEKMEQVDIGNGRRSNQYDIFQYAD